MFRKIKNGDTVKLNFTCTLNDGTHIGDSSEPLTITMGNNALLPKVEESIIGLALLDKKIIELEPKDAFGPYQDNLIIKIPKDNINKDVEVGDLLTTKTNSSVIFVKVLEIADDFVTVDANHPLAGQPIKYEIEILEIKNNDEKNFSNNHSTI